MDPQLGMLGSRGMLYCNTVYTIVIPGTVLTLRYLTRTRVQWGALYSDKGKEIYRWEKRDYTDIKHVINVSRVGNKRSTLT